MPSMEMVLVFMAAALALNLTPGPDMLYVTARSVSDGRAAGVLSAFGIAAGTLVHIAALALGLAALLTAVPLAYDAVRIAGAIYLVVIGIQLILRPRTAAAVAALPRSRLRVIFVQAVITNVLNPKVALFFLAFLPQFVDRSAGPPVPQVLLLGLLFNIQGTLVNVAVALLASRGSSWLRTSERRVAMLRRMTGALFVALGARLAVSTR
ncbi:MAG: LysE family translocator [Betaproteobacteria bacterium]|nr:LysE family translocator [Betaproteobacteria bacterium]MBV9360532.1 LysE family translocator [Betaproteobacteria bacterium]